jgi:hypothetical protein
MRLSMSAPRWLPVFVLVAWMGLAALGATEARAQVFRPRTGKGAPVIKAAAPAAAAPDGKKGAPVAAAPAASSSKTPARASAAPPPRRAAKKKHAKARGDSDVKIDDDDEDVKITDD